MDTRYMKTGDELADQVLALVAAQSRRLPAFLRDDLLSGLRPIDIMYRYMAAQLSQMLERKVERAECIEAVAYLESNGYIRIDEILRQRNGEPPHGVRIWLNASVTDLRAA